jgi:hypothetical protein
MKKPIDILLIAVAAASWSDTLLTDTQMQMFSRIRSANTRLGIGLCLEGIGLVALFASMDAITYGGDPGYIYVSAAAFGIGIITQLVTTMSIASSTSRLNRQLRQDGSDAPRPTGIVVWSLLSAGSMGVAFLASTILGSGFMYYGPAPDWLMGTLGGLELVSIVSAGVTYFSVRGYANEIGWEQYHRARDTVLREIRGEPAIVFLPIAARQHPRVVVPLLSIQY